jgi:NADH:ubiquinone oxidoreductase subunit 6 (subunit J)
MKQPNKKTPAGFDWFWWAKGIARIIPIALIAIVSIQTFLNFNAESPQSRYDWMGSLAQNSYLAFLTLIFVILFYAIIYLIVITFLYWSYFKLKPNLQRERK